MLKNVIIVNDFDYVQGGASKVAIQTANMLSKSNNNLKIYFFSAVHDKNSTLDENVIKICTNQTEAMKNKNIISGFINGIYNFKAKKELKKVLVSLNKAETIIHIHGWTKALSSSVFDIAFKKGFNVVLTMHDYFTACPNGGYFDYKRNIICKNKPLSWKCLKCNCDSRNYLFKIYRIIRQFVQNKIVKLNDKLKDVISISDFSEKILKETLNKNVKIHRIYNPIDLDENHKQINYKDNKYYLYVGRVSKEKGVDMFCEAITRTNQRGIVVGDGAELQMLKEKYNKIEFVGWKNSNEVKKYMQEAKCLIFPSRWYETMGLTVIEAQQYGIPALVSKNCAASEFINKSGDTFSNLNELIEKINNFDNMNFSTADLTNYHKKNYTEKLLNVYRKRD